MSSDISIKVENLSKCYRVYDQPRDRLKQFLMTKVHSAIGNQPQQYYREFWALKDISFEVRKGEKVGIVGRNGSGKSTLLQIITGTLIQTSGSVSTHGRITGLLELGSGFNPDFTGRENVYLNGALLGFSKAQINAKFDDIASFADIGEYLDQPVKTYSSGMQLRLAFAVQVQVEPEILIVDEALAVGDALFQKRCFQRIEQLASNGTTLLFVSHDQETIRTLTDRAMLLNEGKSMEWGLSSEVILKYRKLLHEKESEYYARLTRDMKSQAVESASRVVPKLETDESPASSKHVNSAPKLENRSNQLSFGDGDVKILNVEILNNECESCPVFYPGDNLKIRITCHSFKRISKLNVGIRIRNKEGIKLYSWGTLNQDMSINRKHMKDAIFWDKQFEPGETFKVVLDCDCILGVNLYEVQACVSHEETMNYMSQRMLHWVDEAAFFQVSNKRDEYFFGGVVDLRMNASWES